MIIFFFIFICRLLQGEEEEKKNTKLFRCQQHAVSLSHQSNRSSLFLHRSFNSPLIVRTVTCLPRERLIHGFRQFSPSCRRSDDFDQRPRCQFCHLLPPRQGCLVPFFLSLSVLIPLIFDKFRVLEFCRSAVN